MSHQDVNDEDSDLTFVRKFVLEHALRVFREAITSPEPLDQRYSRLLALGELFNRMLSPKSDRTSSSTYAGPSQHIGKLMYEKNFVSALTSAIAELDLNFPHARRAVKYILGPLKSLADLGVTLSQTSELSSSTTGTTDDEISSATSVSDEDEDEREQTPDLYRNSTLGMFESSGGHDEDDESETDEDDEDEMFDDGYEDDEMDYVLLIGDHGEVVSDEDEEIEAMDDIGEIEGVSGDVEIDVDVVMDAEDDDDTDSEGVSDDDTPDDDDEEGDDDADFTAHMDMEEITGDDENASMPDHDSAEAWEEDDGADFGLGDAVDGGSPHGGPLDQIAQVIGSEETDRHGIVHIDMGNGDDEYFEDELPPDPEEDDGKFLIHILVVSNG